MRCVRCFFLIQLYVLSRASKPRSVNLALETTFEFNNRKDVAIIEKVRKFLNTIESAVDKKLAARMGDDDSDYGFSDFLMDLITTISAYDDDSLKQVFAVLNDEVHNYRYRGSRFNEIMDNDSLRRAITNILRRTNEAPIQFLRAQLKKNLKALKRRKVEKQSTTFLNFLDILYKRKSADTLKQTVENLKHYGKRASDSEFNLSDIIRTAVKTLVYDRYSHLDSNVRRDVKTWLEVVAGSPNYGAGNGAPMKTFHEKKYAKKDRNIGRESARHTNRVYTFVTLYPEKINFEMKKSFDSVPPAATWTKRTVPDKNYFYLIKTISPELRASVRQTDPEPSKGNSSSSSEEEWRSHRRKVTAALWLARHRKKGMPNVPMNKSYRSFIINTLNATKATDYWQRRADQYESDASGNRNNRTPATPSASSNYLERISLLESELNKMKSELSLRLASLPKPVATEANGPLDDYSDYRDDQASNRTRATPAGEAAADGTQRAAGAEAVFRSEVGGANRTTVIAVAELTTADNLANANVSERNPKFRALDGSKEANVTRGPIDLIAGVKESTGSDATTKAPQANTVNVTTSVTTVQETAATSNTSDVTTNTSALSSDSTTSSTPATANTTIRTY